MKRLIIAIVILTLCLSCAKRSSNIEADSISPMLYTGQDCEELSRERQRVGDELWRISTKQDEDATGDAVILTVGTLFFWPLLLAMPFTADNEGEIFKLKGECDAIDEAIENCKGEI